MPEDSHRNTPRKRLAQISHHYLSDDKTEEENRCSVLAVLMEQGYGDTFPINALAEALLYNNVSPVILNVDIRPSTVSMTPPLLSTRFHRLDYENTEDRGNGFIFANLSETLLKIHSNELYLVPLASVYSPYFKHCEKVLIPATASAKGIRHAYIQLKQIQFQSPSLPIGITIIKAQDTASAQDAFDKLAVAAQQFLDVELISYGCLLADGPEKDISACIMGIAGLIRSDEQETNTIQQENSNKALRIQPH